MKIGPLFKWFGSKWQSAKHYPIPTHDLIFEPFSGGAGFSLNYCEKQVHIYDTDPHLSVLWPWLINEAKPSDILEIPVGVPEGTDIRTIGLTSGQATLLKNWQRTNNVGFCWTVSKWGHLTGQWTHNTRSRVADQVGAISHWKFGPGIFENQNPGHWFIDPPYQYNYRYREKTPFDFQWLSSLVRRIPTDSTVVVCEACRKSDGAIPDWLPFEKSHSSVTSRRKSTQSHHSKECIYIRLREPS